MAIPHSNSPLRLSSPSSRFILLTASPGFANWFGKDKQIPDWGLEAAKTHDSRLRQRRRYSVLFDEYVETIDAQGRADERERQVFRVLKPQGRHDADCRVSYDVDEKIISFRDWTIAADEKQYHGQDTDFAGCRRSPDSVDVVTTRTAHRLSPR